MNQQIRPIKAPHRTIERIKIENATIFSGAREKGVNNNINTASRVPIPDIETGKRVTNPAIVIEAMK